MKTLEKLADHDHPLVIQTAKRLTEGLTTDREKLAALFYYVRDDIQFQFVPKGDLVKASELIELKQGQCNNKGTLYLALARALGFPARLHFSLVDKRIQRGLFTGIMYKIMPDKISHCWTEVKVDGKWRNIDSYINDIDFYLAGKEILKEEGWTMGWSIACSTGESSPEFNIDEERFVQMDAVTEDQGVWDDPADYFMTDNYKNRPNKLKLLFYRMTLGKHNRKVKEARKNYQCSIN
jgi:hypothetical protein